MQSIFKNSKGLAKNRYFSSFSNREDAVQKLIFYSILGGNAGVFACWQLASEDRYRLRDMQKHFTVSTYGVRYQHLYHTIVTSFFSHSNVMHFAFNMLGFVSFANSALKELGSGRFILLYYGGGVISSLCHVYAPYLVPRYWPSQRKLETSSGLGASGAISSLLAWYTCRYPMSMLHLFGIVPIPAAVAALGFGALDCYNLYSGDMDIGSASHLGGAAFGIGFSLLTRRRWR